jgi:hypothetical protein
VNAGTKIECGPFNESPRFHHNKSEGLFVDGRVPNQAIAIRRAIGESAIAVRRRAGWGIAENRSGIA